MQKITFLFMALSLAGCTTSPHEDIDTKNSPCACRYQGEQLNTPTNHTEWFEVVTEHEGWS